MSADQIEAKEEYIDNEGTGVEVEDDGSTSSDGPKPWDPDEIRIHTKTFSLRQIIDMIRDDEIDLAPDFQRAYVWKARQKSRLIESILLGIPMPSFYFTEDRESRMQVVDGVQRLTTISGFARDGGFALSDLEYLHKVDGQLFDELDAPLKRRFHNTQVLAHVIDPQTPTAVKFDVFKRINTGGTPLSAQEIRHCMSGHAARELLRDCTQLESFHRATRNSLRDHIRMADREVALRYIAFSRTSVDDYREHPSFDAFLSAMTDTIDTLDEADRAAIVAEFDRSMKLAHDLFGDLAFRRGPGKPLNRALFDVWSVVLAEHDAGALQDKAQELRMAAVRAVEEDAAFVRAISQSTGDLNRVRYRFEKVRSIVADALEVPS